MSQSGQFLQEDFFDNTGGLNISDSAFKVDRTQATGGKNYTYLQTGGIRKRKGHSKINSSADTQLRTLGLSQNNTATGTKTVIRAAGTKLQAVDISAPSFTNLTEDTLAASSDFLISGTTQNVVFSQFNTSSADTLWCAGGEMSSLYGIYSGSKVTKNGSAAPAGSISTLVALTDGSFVTTGTYRYAVALRKASTQALSNASFSEAAIVANTTDTVTIDLSGITGVDTTKYDKFYIYRSAVSGADGFTTGDLIAQIDTTVTSYADTGTYITTATNIPRVNNLLLDNGVLPSGTFKVLTTYKRRLITAKNSTIYFSDINKPESWPGGNEITVPSGGPITGLSVISFTSTGSNTIDELLVIFKERELWIVTGSSIDDYILKFIDSTGCATQSLIVPANGYLAWVDYRGIYLWEGYNKPIYCSRTIEPLFQIDGDLDKTKLSFGVGQFFRSQSLIVWNLSHKIFGEQKLQLKMDLRLTLPGAKDSLISRIMDAVFIMDSTVFSIYGSSAQLPASTEELLLFGDDSGYLYSAYTIDSDANSAYSLEYATKPFDQNNPNIDKRYHYVVVWVEEIGEWNLTLDWWTDYRTISTAKSTRALPISEVQSKGTALWDVAFWDIAFWDDYTSKLRPIFFQLVSDEQNESEGKSLRLQFRQDGANEPVTIAGFSILYSEKGMKRSA